MKRSTKTAILAGAVGAITAGVALAAPGASTGPSSSASPYLVRTIPGVNTTSILTVGDAAPNGYRMVGIPDGLGAYDNGGGTFTLLMNHELGGHLGAVRAHGATGAFVSKWTIEKGSLRVRSGEDLIKRVYVRTKDTDAWTQAVTAISRLCSGDLPDVSAFYDAATRTGTTNRIFMSGEESGAEGRAFAHVATGPDAGSSYELPHMGKMSFENVVAQPDNGKKTVVVNLDDSGGGQVYIYVGEKQSTGNDVEKAGLANGKLYGLKIDGVPTELDSTTIPAKGVGFKLIEIPGAASMNGATLERVSTELGVSKLARPEDGSFDPTNEQGFYFATTGSFRGISRLWHLQFEDAADVTKGGIATVPVASPAYDTTKKDADQAGPRMIDNITVNDRGQVLLQEDPGGNPYLSGIFQYDAKSGNVQRIARHDADRFAPGAPNFLTIDEESSGIIPVPFLGKGKYLFDVQAHYRPAQNAAELVEGGQLGLITIPPGKPVR